MIAGILLAAGRSSRFGADKLLHRLPDGEPIAVASARNLRGAVDCAVAVLRADQSALRTCLEPLGFVCTVCENAEQGMGASLAAGVQAVPDARGWLVALADMPRIRPHTVLAVANGLRAGASIVAPTYDGQRGHPVGFDQVWRDELLALGGDAGARELLRRQVSRIMLVPCDDPGIIYDIDAPADLGLINLGQYSSL